MRCLEAFRVLLPEKAVQEDAHGVHADGFSPAQFAIDGGRIKGIGLPHFKLVDGGGGQKIRADRPRLLRVPCVGLCFCPALLRMKSWKQGKQSEGDKSLRRLHETETHRAP
jgi:hypothetical protein